MFLRFDDAALERRYLRDDAESSRRRYRLMWSITAVAWAATSIIDVMLASSRETLVAVLAIRLGFCLPVLLGVVGFSFSSPERFERGWQVAGFLGSVAVAASITAMGRVSTPSGAATAERVLGAMLLGFVASTLVVHTVLIFRFRWATLSTVFGSLMFLASLSRGPAAVVVYAAFWLVIANAVGMIGSYLLESYRRQVFHQRHLLDLERAKSESLLTEELRHQVAARSRELGEAFARVDLATGVSLLSPGERVVE